MSVYACNAVAASTFVIWDYCITFDDEIEFIWRQKWSWVTVVFSITRYVPIISSNVLLADSIVLLFPISNDGCVAWLVAYSSWTLVLIICLQTLLIARVLALYGQLPLLRYFLIALIVCVNIARVTLLSIGKYKSYIKYVDSNLPLLRCDGTWFPSTQYSAIFAVEFIPQTTCFLLAVVKLIHTRRTVNIGVSQLLVVIVRDGSWAFALVFVSLLWIVLQLKLSGHGGIAYLWVAPLIGFTSSKLIINLRFKAESQPGGTDVGISEINFAPIDPSNTVHETV